MPTSFFAEWPVSGAVAQEIDALLAQIEAAKDQVLAAKAAVENVQAVIDSQEVITARDDALAARGGAEAARDQAQAYASQVQDVSDAVEAVTQMRDAATGAASEAEGYANDAANKAQEAQTAAQAALGSASEAADAVATARLFAEGEPGVPFTLDLAGEEGEPETFFSAKHYAQQAQQYAQASAEVPWRTLQESEISADAYPLQSSDLNKWLRVNRASNLTIQVNPSLHQAPGSSRWVKVSKEGAGNVTFASPGGTAVAPSLLGFSSAGYHWPTPNGSGKPAGTVQVNLTAKAGQGRRLILFLWAIHATTQVDRNLSIVLDTGYAVTELAPDTYTGGSSTCSSLVAAADIGDSAADQPIVATVTHGDQFWAVQIVAYTVSGGAGYEGAYTGGQNLPAASTASADITTGGAQRLVLFGATIRGGGGTPATLNRGTLAVTAQTGGLAFKDFGFVSGYEVVPAASTLTYTATFLKTTGISSSIVAVLPSASAGGTIKAPGDRLTLSEANGHAYVLLPGDGTVLIEGT